jgi:hypothetical protein
VDVETVEIRGVLLIRSREKALHRDVLDVVANRIIDAKKRLDGAKEMWRFRWDGGILLSCLDLVVESLCRWELMLCLLFILKLYLCSVKRDVTVSYTHEMNACAMVFEGQSRS